jgi:hypothetical protein
MEQADRDRERSGSAAIADFEVNLRIREQKTPVDWPKELKSRYSRSRRQLSEVRIEKTGSDKKWLSVTRQNGR